MRPLRIVVTDDDPSLLTRVVEVLRGAGHVVFAAYDGLAACELTQVIARLDLLITNTRITNLDAPELIARVRAVKPELAILHLGRPLPAGGPYQGRAHAAGALQRVGAPGRGASRARPPARQGQVSPPVRYHRNSRPVDSYA